MNQIFAPVRGLGTYLV